MNNCGTCRHFCGDHCGQDIHRVYRCPEDGCIAWEPNRRMQLETIERIWKLLCSGNHATEMSKCKRSLFVLAVDHAEGYERLIFEVHLDEHNNPIMTDGLQEALEREEKA